MMGLLKGGKFVFDHARRSGEAIGTVSRARQGQAIDIVRARPAKNNVIRAEERTIAFSSK
jgi:hypothetical protein